MEREHENALLSLQRLPDWNTYLDYVMGIIHELEVTIAHMDPSDALGIARTQGGRFALINLVNTMPTETNDE